jgi:hypothetical protein
MTRSEVALMQRDNVFSADCAGLSSLDITPTEIDTLVPLGAKYSRDDDRILKG